MPQGWPRAFLILKSPVLIHLGVLFSPCARSWQIFPLKGKETTCSLCTYTVGATATVLEQKEAQRIPKGNLLCFNEQQVTPVGYRRQALPCAVVVLFLFDILQGGFC